MIKLLTKKSERGNSIVFSLASVAILVLLFGFSIDSIRFLHVRTTVQQALDRTAVSWLTAYNYSTATTASGRRADANNAAQTVYRDNISSIENMLYCSGECGAVITILGTPTATRVRMTVTEKMDFVYLDSIVGGTGLSLEDALNNNPRTSSYISEAFLGEPTIP